MEVGIKGIRLDNVHLELEKDQYIVKTGQYSLISTKDKVLAKQMVNGYGDMKIEPSSQTKELLDNFLQSFRNDLNVMIGL